MPPKVVRLPSDTKSVNDRLDKLLNEAKSQSKELEVGQREFPLLNWTTIVQGALTLTGVAVLILAWTMRNSGGRS